MFIEKERAKVMWGYVNQILGQPLLIGESSIARFPGLELISQAKNKILKSSTSVGATWPVGSKNGIGNIVLHPSLQRRMEQLSHAIANTKTH